MRAGEHFACVCMCVYSVCAWDRECVRMSVHLCVYCVYIYERLFKTLFYSEAHCSR